MKKFKVNIWAYNHHAKFTVESQDSPTDLEQSILDKLGENSIVWENLGVSYDDKINRITYEEVKRGARAKKSKKVPGVGVGKGASR